MSTVATERLESPDSALIQMAASGTMAVSTHLALAAEVGAALAREEVLQGMLQLVAEALVRHLDAAFARIWTSNDVEQVLELQASAGMYTHLDGAHSRIRVGEYKIGEIAEERRPHLTNQVIGDPRVSDQAWAMREGMVAFAGYPLIVENRLVGVMALFARQPFPDDALDALASVADIVAIGIERKHSEAALKHQMQLLRTITDNAASCLFMMDERGHPTFMNPAAEQVTGYTLDEIRDRPLHYAIHSRRPDGRYYPMEECPIDSAAAELVPLREQEEIFHRKDGTLFPVAFSVAPIERESKTVGAVLEFRDITDAKRVEAALREETETLQTVNRVGRLLSAELELDTLLQAVTDAATDLSGAQFGAFFYNVIDDQGGHYTRYTISGVPREAFSRFPLPRNTALFGPTFHGEGIIRLDDVRADSRYGQNAPYYGMPAGHLPVVSYLAVPVISRAGAVLGGLFFGHEQAGVFTERAEQIVSGLAAQAAVAVENAQLYQQAQQAIRTRDEFLSTAAHDLRTPLGSIKGLAQLTQRRALRLGTPETLQLVEGLQTINTSATRMAGLIDELLDVARLQMGRPLELDRRPHDLVALAERAVESLRPTTDRHRLVVEPEEERLIGEWDEARLARVLDNLLSNAIKYSPDGGTIIVSLGREAAGSEAMPPHNGEASLPSQPSGRAGGEVVPVPANDGWAVLSVRDQGIGIPATDLPWIFERFQRGGNAVGKIYGTGLGLTSVRHIVESHGGTVSAASVEGQGSTFTVRLPLAGEGSDE